MMRFHWTIRTLLLMGAGSVGVAVGLCAGGATQAQPDGRAVARPGGRGQQAAAQQVLIPPRQPGLAGNVAECSAAASAVAELPDSVDLVVVVERAADLRTSPLGGAAVQFLSESGILDELTKAWGALAKQLGWDEKETFDRLLGQRVVLLSRGAAGGEARRWAVLSDITVDTEERLKAKLQAAPRAIEQGHQILTVENGQYELTSHHRAGQAARKQGKAVQRLTPTDRVTVVLGPTGKSELFDEMIGVLSRGGPVGGGGLANREVFKQACQAGPAEVLVLAALTEADPLTAPDPGAANARAGGAPEPWRDFFLLAGRRDREKAANRLDGREDSTWHSRVVVRQTARAAALMRIEPTSDAAFRSLASGAMLAVVQNAPLQQVLGSKLVEVNSILGALPIPEIIKKQMTDRQAIRLSSSGPENRICCTMATRTNDTEQLARTFDGEIAHAIQRLEKQFGAEATPLMDYSGLAPNAVRVVPLAASAQGGLSLFTSRPLAVAWAYPSQVALNGPANMNDRVRAQLGCAPPAPVDGQRAGWWVMSVCQVGEAAGQQAEGCALKPLIPLHSCKATPGELLRSDANSLLCEDPNAQTARWVWLVHAQPAALEGLLPSMIPDVSGVRSGMRRFETVDLRLRITDAGDIQGDLSLRLAPAAK